MGVQINGDTGNISATKADYSGNVTIGGTLTYEDVTNIDSVGLVTAREGIEVGARPGVAASISVDGNMIVSGISTFGGDINVVSDINLADYIVHTGDLDSKFGFATADTFTVETGGTERTRVDSNGNMALGIAGAVPTNSAYNAACLHINQATNSSSVGAQIHLTTANSGTTASDGAQISQYNNSLYINNQDSGTVQFYNNGGERLRIGSSGQIGIAGANYGTSGQVITSQGSGSAVQWATPAGATSGTYTSFGTGYYVDITTTSTNIVKYDIMFTGVSCGGGTDWQFQLGDSGGVESSGYEVVASYRSHNSSNNTNNRDNAFRWHGTGNSGFIMDGKFSLTRIHNNKWFGEGQLVRTEAGSTLYDMWGTKELSGALTTIRISSSSDDSEVFDGGYYKVIEYTGTV